MTVLCENFNKDSMQINIYRLLAPALCIILFFLAGWTLLATILLVVIAAVAITIALQHGTNGVTEMHPRDNDLPFPRGTGLCFYIPIQGKTPLQTLTYNRKFNSGTETFTSQKNSCL